MQHLRALPLRPRRRLVPGNPLEFDLYVAVGAGQHRPLVLAVGLGIRRPAEQLGVKTRQGERIGAVEDARPDADRSGHERSMTEPRRSGDGAARLVPCCCPVPVTGVATWPPMWQEPGRPWTCWHWPPSGWPWFPTPTSRPRGLPEQPSWPGGSLCRRCTRRTWRSAVRWPAAICTTWPRTRWGCSP